MLEDFIYCEIDNMGAKFFAVSYPCQIECCASEFLLKIVISKGSKDRHDFPFQGIFFYKIKGLWIPLRLERESICDFLVLQAFCSHGKESLLKL